jgi:hypothetical protein
MAYCVKSSSRHFDPSPSSEDEFRRIRLRCSFRRAPEALPYFAVWAVSRYGSNPEGGELLGNAK